MKQAILTILARLVSAMKAESRKYHALALPIIKGALEPSSVRNPLQRVAKIHDSRLTTHVIQGGFLQKTFVTSMRMNKTGDCFWKVLSI